MTRGNAAGNFEHATYIGFNKTNCEHKFISEDDVIVTSRHVVRLPEGQGWNCEKLKNIIVTPWEAKSESKLK